jgi:hypothetical protein
MNGTEIETGMKKKRVKVTRRADFWKLFSMEQQLRRERVPLIFFFVYTEKEYFEFWGTTRRKKAISLRLIQIYLIFCALVIKWKRIYYLVVGVLYLLILLI